MAVEAANHSCFTSHKVRTLSKATSPKQRQVHFEPMLETDQQKWEELLRAMTKDEMEEVISRKSAGAIGISSKISSLLSMSHIKSTGRSTAHTLIPIISLLHRNKDKMEREGLA